jgi:hypothetical protein
MRRAKLAPPAGAAFGARIIEAAVALEHGLKERTTGRPVCVLPLPGTYGGLVRVMPRRRLEKAVNKVADDTPNV